MRPKSLIPYEKLTYGRIVKTREVAEKDTIKIDSSSPISKRMKLEAILRGIIGGNVLTYTNQKLEPGQQGYFGINSILNLLLAGYSNNQELCYKSNTRGGYKLTNDSDPWPQSKTDYSFRLKQPYFRASLIYYFDKRHNAYLKTALPGNRHTKNRRLANELNLATDNNPIWKGTQLDKFKDTYWDRFTNYDLTKYIDFQAGLILHHRPAVHEEGFVLINESRVYFSLVPKSQM